MSSNLEPVPITLWLRPAASIVVGVRLHVHVRKAEKVAKFWMEPHVSVAGSYGMTSSELHMLSKVVEDNIELIRSAWNGYFNQ